VAAGFYQVENGVENFAQRIFARAARFGWAWKTMGN
jgi:hypothetical protein